MPYDLVLRNCRVLTYHSASQRFVDEETNIGIRGGKIEKVTSSHLSGLQEISLKGLAILPGVIDSQVHFREPGLTHKEDLESGTRGAALGGVTSVFEMPNTQPATTSRERHQEKLRLAAGRAWVNYAFFVGASPENVKELAELELLPHCPGIKIFMGSSTGTLLVEDESVLRQIFRNGKRRLIIHSEDELRLRERKHLALESRDPAYHPIWRDELTALKSTERLLRVARETGRKVHVLHVSTEEELEILAQNRDLASVEVLPQHLTLASPKCYELLGTLAQQNPPIRGERHQRALWKALQSGRIDVIGSDHAPHTLEEKAREYPQSPSGVPGVQTLVPIMLHHIHQGNLSLERFVSLVCENPRWVFGCTSKGRINEGFDADLTIVDLKAKKTIQNSWIASKSQWSPFAGMQVMGWPKMTVVGGNFVMQEDQLIGSPRGTAVEFKTDI